MPHRSRFPAFTLAGTATLWLVAACGGSTDIITPPPPPTTGFTLSVLPNSEDLATATALGWQTGIPGAAVTLIPENTSIAPRSFTSSAQGTVTIPDLAAGDYVVEATRWLTAAELATLPPGDDGYGFTTQYSLRVGTASPGVQLSVPASRRKSLVISEWFFNTGRVPGVGSYGYGGYLELYNNADTTVFLDGIRIGEAYSIDVVLPYASCAEQATVKADPGFLWSGRWERFPGTGRDTPLGPGKTVVVATDAIDHRPLVPDGLDLSSADFEFAGFADVDNPAVPNMINDGLRSDQRGHGFIADIGVSVMFIAAPLDLQGLPTRRGPGTTLDYLGFSRGLVLDVVALREQWVSATPECLPIVHPQFDRETERLMNSVYGAGYKESVQRHVRSIPGVAHPILQATRSTRADFFNGPRSPGTVQP
jgi:hypothetical protein